MVSKPLDYESIYPHIWNQYEFLYNQMTILNNILMLLMGLDTLVIMVLFELYDKKYVYNIVWFIQLLFLFVIPIFLWLWGICIRKVWVPFVEKGSLKDIWLNDKDFYEEAVVDIYGVLHHLSAHREQKKTIIKFLLISLIVGTFGGFAIQGALMNNIGVCIFFIFIYTFALVLVICLWNKEYPKKNNEPTENRKFFDDLKRKIINKEINKESSVTTSGTAI